MKPVMAGILAALPLMAALASDEGADRGRQLIDEWVDDVVTFSGEFEQVLLGAGDQLYGYQMGESSLVEMGSLAEHGIDMVMGMVIDPETGFLHVVDGADGELVVLRI